MKAEKLGRSGKGRRVVEKTARQFFIFQIFTVKSFEDFFELGEGGRKKDGAIVQKIKIGTKSEKK